MVRDMKCAGTAVVVSWFRSGYTCDMANYISILCSVSLFSHSGESLM